MNADETQLVYLLTRTDLTRIKYALGEHIKSMTEVRKGFERMRGMISGGKVNASISWAQDEIDKTARLLHALSYKADGTPR